MEEGGAWDWAKTNGWAAGDQQIPSTKQDDSIVWSVWSGDFVAQISRNTAKVTGSWALGSVLVIRIRPEGGKAGYEDNSAVRLQDFLRRRDHVPFAIHSRVLGNVLYIMAGQKTSQETVVRIQELVSQWLGMA